MKKIIIFFSLSFIAISYQVNAQPGKIDSLQNLLSQHTQKDTIRVNLLLDLGKIIQMKDPVQAEKIANEIIKISESINYLYGTSFGYLRLGFCNSLMGKDSLAQICYKKSLSLAEKIKNNYIIGNVFTNVGTYYYSKIGNSDSALFFYTKSLEAFKKTDKQENTGFAFGNVGGVYMAKGDYNTALKYLLQAQKNLEATNSKSKLPIIYFNLSVVYAEQLQNKKMGYEYALKSLAAAEETGDKISMGLGNERLGTLENDIIKSREYFKRALSIFQEINYTDAICRELNEIGKTYYNPDNNPDYNLAIEYFKRSIRESTGDKLELATSYEGIGKALCMKKQINAGLNYFFEAMKISQKNNFMQGVRYDLESISWAYAEKGDYKNAYTYHKLFASLRDSILNVETVKSLNEMGAKYNNEKKEIQIALLTKDKEIQHTEIQKQKLLKNFLIGGVGLILIMVFLGYRTYRTRQLLKLQTLRNKIASDLHDDVGSTLSSISIFSEMAKEQSSEVTPMLEQIGDSSRKMLDAMADIVWTINPENDQFEKIILRMKSFAYELLGAKKIDFEFEADENVATLKLPMDVRKNLYLIFKEATNNMVKYADANKASFSISGNKEKLTMFIRDNGKGFDVNKDSQGNGLKNMKRRAQEIGANLLIESEAGIGTTIQLILNLA